MRRRLVSKSREEPLVPLLLTAVLLAASAPPVLADADLGACKINNKTLVGNDEIITYAICAYNRGPDPVEAFEVVDQLPPNLVMPTSTSGGMYNSADHSWSWTVGPLGPGQSVLLQVTGTVDGGDQVENWVEAIPPTGSFDPALTNNTFVDVDSTTPGGGTQVFAHNFNCGLFWGWAKVEPAPEDLCRGEDDPLYADGFECGDTSKWSTTVR